MFLNIKAPLEKRIWVIPALITFIIALIPTVQYQWPLSWDIIIHIQYAMVYAKHGFVLTDPLLNAPFGQKIGYPPLFHFILVFLGMITRIDYFQIARALQPFLAMFIVSSVSYVAWKFYGTIAAVSAGFLVLSSVLFGRIILPIPENLALIFLPLSIYFYYRSIQDQLTRYALLSGILFITVILTHQAATLILISTITMITLVDLIVYRRILDLKSYGYFLLPAIFLAVIGFIALLLWKPDIVYSIFNQGISTATGLLISISNRPLNFKGYLDIGYLVLLFGIIGIVLSLLNTQKLVKKEKMDEITDNRKYIKKKDRKSLFILTWILLTFILSIAYWFGINVISYRLLVYLLLPLSIIGGFGLREIYRFSKNYGKHPLDKLGVILLLAVFVVSIASATLTVEKTGFNEFKVENQYGTLEIAPPSASMVDLAEWFDKNGDKNRSILTNNLFTGTYLATVTGMPIHYGFEDFNKNISQSSFKEANIGYLVLDKRLSLNKTGSLNLISVKSEFYPLVYFSKPVNSSLNELLPDFIKVVYENHDYIVCQIY